MEDKASGAWAIEVQGLTKSFGNRLILKGIDLKVRKGEFLTVFGPNGAGKTTVLRVLGTMLKPSGGQVKVSGLDLKHNSAEIRRGIGVVTHQTMLYDELTSFENLKFYGKMYDVPNLEERIEEVVTKLGLGSRLHHRVRTLSRGLQQRLSIARAVLHNPTLMLLDEPGTGLDQHAANILAGILRAVNDEGRTVIMTTHSLERGLEMGDHVVILAEGRIVYEESKRALDMLSLQEAYHHYTGARQ